MGRTNTILEMAGSDWLTVVFCKAGDFCQAFEEQREAYLSDSGAKSRPELCLTASEIITLLPALHSSRFNSQELLYGFAASMLRQRFCETPCCEQFVTRQRRALLRLLCFSLSRMGKQSCLYFRGSTSSSACGNQCIQGRSTLVGPAVAACWRPCQLRFATAAALINEMVEAKHHLQLGCALPRSAPGSFFRSSPSGAKRPLFI